MKMCYLIQVNKSLDLTEKSHLLVTTRIVFEDNAVKEQILSVCQWWKEQDVKIFTKFFKIML